MRVYLTITIIILLAITACTTDENMNKTVVIQTNKGTFEVQLNHDKAPITTENFLRYVNEGFYDGTVFHRVIPKFMIQGGGFTQDGKQKAVHDPIKLESNNGLKNTVGSIAMARTPDPNSATSQFFINTANNDFLNKGARDDGYAVFGKVVSGMDVVNTIGSVQTTKKHGMPDWPVEEVIIQKAYVKQ